MNNVCVKNIASQLNHINFSIAELQRKKEELEIELCSALAHGDDYQKTYIEDVYKITVTTGYNYSLNKNEYEILSSRLNSCFNPVKTKTVYEIDKKIFKQAEDYASSDEMNLLSQFIVKKPKKIHIKISAGV